MTIGDLFTRRRAAPFLRGHYERRLRARRTERRLVATLMGVCVLQFVMLLLAITF